MELQLEVRGSAMVARLSGEIDLAVADTLRSSLENTLDNNPGVKDIVVSLGGVQYIDSSGLGVLLGRYKRVSRTGGRVFLVGAPPTVRRIVEMSGLFRIMMEFPSEEDAIKYAG